MEVTGFDELQHKLDTLENNARELKLECSFTACSTTDEGILLNVASLLTS